MNDISWEKHILNVTEYAYNNNPTKAPIFVKRYKKFYDEYHRIFLNKRIAWSLLDDYAEVKTGNNIRWYAVVGEGGTGKTTLAINVAYWLDRLYNLERLTMEHDGFVNILDSLPLTNAMKSVILDEPDERHHSQSKEGKSINSVLNKARQQKVFIINCATELKDIPSGIWKRLTGVFFTPYKPKAYFFKNRLEFREYVMAHIRGKYSAGKGYSVFQEIIDNKTFPYIPFETKDTTPFTKKEQKDYIEYKTNDYKNTIKKAKKILSKEVKKSDDIPEIIKYRYKLWKGGLTQKQIGTAEGVTPQTINISFAKYKEKLDIWYKEVGK